MALSDAQLATLREQLLAERREMLRTIEGLGVDIGRIVEARQDSNVDDEHDPEGSTIAFERSQSDALLRQSRLRLSEIEAAIARMDASAYGVCEACGRDIPPARLEARPSARRCVDCASRT